MTQQKPVKEFRSGRIQASIWKNEVVKDGATVLRHSVRIQKQYRKEDGDYQNTDYYFDNDLPHLALVSQKAFEFLALRERTPEDAS